MALELDKMKHEIKDLKTQLNEKHVKASKAAADQAAIEALEEEKVRLSFVLCRLRVKRGSQCFCLVVCLLTQ